MTSVLSDRRALARIALAVVDGVTDGDADAGALITSAFDDPDPAAHSDVYPCGFILQVLGTAGFGGSTALAASEVRRLLDTLE
jgi:hypothetical protein